MPNEERKQCPVCKYAHPTLVKIDNRIEQPFVEDVQCWRCGSFSIPPTDLPTGKYDGSRHLISGYIREFNVKRYQPGFMEPIVIDEERLKAIVSETANYHVPRKTDKLLLALGALTKTPGQKIEINDERDCPLAYAKDRRELQYYLRYLIKPGFLEAPNNVSVSPVIITPQGWTRISDLESKGAESKQAFVAMSFLSQYDELYEAIKDSVDMAGMEYKASRLDDPQDPELIDYALIARMRESRFLIADLSQNNHGVYYEAGYMRALGRHVIYTCKDLDENGCLVDLPGETLHFDVTHWPTLFWNENDFDKFKRELSDWIKAWGI